MQLIMSNKYTKSNFQRGALGGRGGHQKRDQQKKSNFQQKKPFKGKNFCCSRKKRKKIKSSR